MSVARVRPSSLRSGIISLPPSKSHTMRALVLAAMAHGQSEIVGALVSPDTEAMIRCITALGATVRNAEGVIIVDGIGGDVGSLYRSYIDIGNSGLALRFATALCALSHDPIVISGDSSIQQLRPIGPLVVALEQLGAKISYEGKKGFAPLRIQGPLSAGSCVVDGTDSQPVSALLVATSFLKGNSCIRVENMGERPWVDVTLAALHRCGIFIERPSENLFHVSGSSRIEGFHRTIPKDASALAFPLIAALVTGSKGVIDDVPFDDVQKDIAIIDYVRHMGGCVERTGNQLIIDGPQSLQGIDVDINDIVDVLPIFAVLATRAQGKTRLYNGAVCRNKESDRIHGMAVSLRAMGAAVIEHQDGLTIFESRLHGASLSCYSDHRVAMALCIAGLIASGETVIHGVECVRKSFPSFFSVLTALGADIEVVE